MTNRTFKPSTSDNAYRVFRGRNFMTPHVLMYYEDGKGNFCELSSGIGIGGNELFGCTFAGKDYDQNDNNINRCFSTIKEAKYYIGSV